MKLLTTPFVVMKNVLSESDILFLKNCCKNQLQALEIPCYSLLSKQEEPIYLRIVNLIQDKIQLKIDYLNDFYFYTDSSSSADWHMDTELFTFKNALNAWILLSPETISTPLEMITSINDDEDRFYHSVNFNNGLFNFSNLYSGDSESITKIKLDSLRSMSPDIEVGDILLFEPKKFHRTFTSTPKHCFVIKFVFGGFDNLSTMQVSDVFWPEVAVFNRILAGKNNWNEVLEGIRNALSDIELRKILCSGFFPDRFSFYKTASETL